MKKDYSKIIGFFERNGFNSYPYLLKILSYLPPDDRCEILTALLAFFPRDVNLYNKLSMATLKNGNYNKAIKILQDAYSKNNLSLEFYSQLVNKIDFLFSERDGNYGSSNNYYMTLSLLQNETNRTYADISWDKDSIQAHKEFCQIMVEFCNNQIE